MVNYKLGKIYKLTSGDLTYYGSTCEPTLSRRLAKHVNTYRSFKNNNKGHYVTSFEILKNDDYNIVLVEKFPCNCKDELLAREAYYITNNDCVNKVIPNQSKKEYRDKHIAEKKVLDKNYYLKNKEVIKQKTGNYRNENKQKYSEYHKVYRAENKEKLKKSKAEYSSAIVTCECGLQISRGSLLTHKKSNRHKNRLIN